MRSAITGPFESSRLQLDGLPESGLERRDMNHMTRSGKEILTFLILTFALSSVPYYLIITAGSLSAAND